MEIPKTLIDALVSLDNVSGASGDETEVADALRAQMDGLYDEHFEDSQGNQFYIKKGSSAENKILLSAHMDEIGFIISYIDESGFASIMPVGYHDDRMAVNQDLVFRTAAGGKVSGITGSKPAHIMSEEDHEKVIKIADLFVDFGTDSAEETRALGIEIGDYGTFDRQGRFLNGGEYYSGKSVDDRAGLACLVELFRRLQSIEHAATVVAVGTVQEEVGMRAGGPIVNRVKPDIMFAVDVTLTGGTPGIEWKHAANRMGGGVSFNYFDWDPVYGMTGNNVPRRVTQSQIAIAEKYGIPYQRGVITGGGTDAWLAYMAGEGYLTGGINIPSRYVHTAVGTVKLSDMVHTVEFMCRYVADYEGAWNNNLTRTQI
ncbi:MAG: M42 family metallopeptidase [Clostridiales Family XIII bacterium]|jgi:endoglucanase|nr:M42 family metallopeptidase [Clostridiales Family XIII bacterium]